MSVDVVINAVNFMGFFPLGSNQCDFANFYSLRLPGKLVLEWPEEDKLEPNSKIPAGTTIGMYS